MLIITDLLIGSPFSVAAKVIRADNSHSCSSAFSVTVTEHDVFAVLAMYDRLIPQLHRHALKLAAGGVVSITRWSVCRKHLDFLVDDLVHEPCCHVRDLHLGGTAESCQRNGESCCEQLDKRYRNCLDGFSIYGRFIQKFLIKLFQMRWG